jgi:hypothetical protein
MRLSAYVVDRYMRLTGCIRGGLGVSYRLGVNVMDWCIRDGLGICDGVGVYVAQSA